MQTHTHNDAAEHTGTNQDTGWRRTIGCLKFFRKRATNYRALVQKMTYEDKASYDSTPPCTLHEYTCIHIPVPLYVYPLHKDADFILLFWFRSIRKKIGQMLLP